jgi:signal transduction histidine kinase
VAFLPKDEARAFLGRLMAARRSAQTWTTPLVPLYRPPVDVVVAVRPASSWGDSATVLHWSIQPAAENELLRRPAATHLPARDEPASGDETLRRAFLSAMTHELLTPLAIIQGNAETLRYPAVRADQAQVERALGTIQDETARLRRLVQNVIDTARASAGELEIHPQPASLEPLLTRAVERFETRSRRHHFVLHLPSAVPLVLADLERLESVIYNLLDNALKYSPRGGEIRVRVRTRPRDVEVSVADEGLGIPAGEEAHVFAPYYRASQQELRSQGSGLGLYLSKAVIDGHGGRIWIERPVGGGTAVCFTLPRA